MNKIQKAKHSFEQSAAPIALAALLLTGAVAMGDSLFANTHIALYGPLPAASSSDYTPVQKNDVSSKAAAAKKRSDTRKALASSSLKAAASASSSSVSSSRPSSASSVTSSAKSSSSLAPLLFEKIDDSTCTKDNLGGCSALIKALAYKGNPACLRNTMCSMVVLNAGNTVECWKNQECSRAAAALGLWRSNSVACITDPTNCRRQWEILMQEVDMMTR